MSSFVHNSLADTSDSADVAVSDGEVEPPGHETNKGTYRVRDWAYPADHLASMRLWALPKVKFHAGVLRSSVRNPDIPCSQGPVPEGLPQTRGAVPGWVEFPPLPTPAA